MYRFLRGYVLFLSDKCLGVELLGHIYSYPLPIFKLGCSSLLLSYLYILDPNQLQPPERPWNKRPWAGPPPQLPCCWFVRALYIVRIQAPYHVICKHLLLVCGFVFSFSWWCLLHKFLKFLWSPVYLFFPLAAGVIHLWIHCLQCIVINSVIAGLWKPPKCLSGGDAWTDVVCTHNGMLFSLKEKGNSDLHHMFEPSRFDVE